MARHSAAHYVLEGLTELGIDYLFCNLGTDHVSLIEEMARWDQGNRPRPPAILCPHENVAVHMAGGYAMMTGRGQAVLVHVDAGTANAAMAMHNHCRGRVPVFLMAGRAPFTRMNGLSNGTEYAAPSCTRFTSMRRIEPRRSLMSWPVGMLSAMPLPSPVTM